MGRESRDEYVEQPEQGPGLAGNFETTSNVLKPLFSDYESGLASPTYS